MDQSNKNTFLLRLLIGGGTDVEAKEQHKIVLFSCHRMVVTKLGGKSLLYPLTHLSPCYKPFCRRPEV